MKPYRQPDTNFTFPFKANEKIKIKIDPTNKKLTIEKTK